MERGAFQRERTHYLVVLEDRYLTSISFMIGIHFMILVVLQHTMPKIIVFYFLI